MAISKPWYKTWSSWLSDPDLARLNLGQVGAWWKLYALAHKCGAGGQLVTESGRPLTIEEICRSLHISDSAEVKVFKNMVEKQLDAGSLCWEDDILTVTHYSEEQETSTTGTSIKGSKEALRARVARFREKKKKAQIPFPLEPPSPKDKDSTVSSSVNVNNTTEDEEGNGVTSVTEKPESRPDVTDAPLPEGGTRAGEGREKGLGGLPGVTDTPLQNDPIIAEIVRLYVENIGELPHGGVVIEDMVEFAGRFRGDVKWIKLAFKEACRRNKRNWNYIQTILERWNDEGGPDGRAGQELARESRREENGGRGVDEADRRGAPGPGTKHQWKVKRSGPEPVQSGEEK